MALTLHHGRKRPPQGEGKLARTAFGSRFLAKLDEPVLIIGSDTWTRSQLAQDLGVINVIAAGKLSRYCADHRIRNTQHLYDRSTPYSFASEVQVGVTTLYVAWHAFRAKGLNPEAWYVRGEKGATRSFVTYKRRESAAEARTKAGAKKRTA